MSHGDKNAVIQGALNKLNAKLRDHAGGFTNDGAACNDIEQSYRDAINAAGKDSDLGKRLQAELDNFHATGNGGDQTLSNDEMSRFSDNVKDMVTDLGTASQQDLFALQNAAQERTQFIQTVSNLLSTMNQAAATTVNNLK